MVDETPVGAWAWLGLLVLANAYWISFDLWAKATNHEFMTTEFREALAHPLWGPLVSGATAFTAIAFIVHMWNLKAGQ